MIAESLTDINLNNIYILPPLKNNLIIDGLFYKILYSNDLYISNGIYINVVLNNINYNCVNYNSYNYRVDFDVTKNYDIIEKIQNIETYILTNVIDKINKNVPGSGNNKKICYKITEQFKSGEIKLNNHTNSFILKLSGVWENNNSIGVSYKIMHINKSLKF
jgi:hypothetical protein